MKMIVPLAVETLQRKLIRSIAQHGILRTVQRCVVKPWEVLRCGFRSLLPRELSFHAEEREFDKRHNVDTCGRWDPGWMARIASPNWKYGIGYAPVPVNDATRILAGLNIDYHQFVFVDLGAGKGRAVLVAAQFPFRRIVGVEYSPALADVMKANISSFRNRLKCRSELTGLLQDAVQYELPREPLVLFFHHPFEAPIFHQVRERIEKSLADCPRRILVIYYDPQCRSVFDESPHFGLLQQGVSDGRSAASGDWIVYESLLTAAPAR